MNPANNDVQRTANRRGNQDQVNLPITKILDIPIEASFTRKSKRARRVLGQTCSAAIGFSGGGNASTAFLPHSLIDSSSSRELVRSGQIV